MRNGGKAATVGYSRVRVVETETEEESEQKRSTPNSDSIGPLVGCPRVWNDSTFVPFLTVCGQNLLLNGDAPLAGCAQNA